MILDDARAKLEEYLDAWLQKDYKAMWAAVQLTAHKVMQFQMLYEMCQPMNLVKYEILENREWNEDSWYIDFRVRQDFEQPIMEDGERKVKAAFVSTFRVIREVKAFKPTSTGGTWGVNPISGTGWESVGEPTSQEGPKEKE